MKEHPILFSGPMIRAILAEKNPKTQTRRLVKPQPERRGEYEAQYAEYDADRNVAAFYDRRGGMSGYDAKCPYGKPGTSRLWVREGLRQYGKTVTPMDLITGRQSTAQYAATMTPVAGGPNGTDPAGRALWRWQRSYLPSMFMPRWASRITLEVVSVRVERLQEISEEDAVAEGVDAVSLADVPRSAAWNRRQDFAALWDSLNSKRGPWDSNHWVWVVEFERVEA